jgi:hypothetical protein
LLGLVWVHFLKVFNSARSVVVEGFEVFMNTRMLKSKDFPFSPNTFAEAHFNWELEES